MDENATTLSMNAEDVRVENMQHRGEQDHEQCHHGEYEKADYSDVKYYGRNRVQRKRKDSPKSTRTDVRQHNEI